MRKRSIHGLRVVELECMNRSFLDYSRGLCVVNDVLLSVALQVANLISLLTRVAGRGFLGMCHNCRTLTAVAPQNKIQDRSDRSCTYWPRTIPVRDIRLGERDVHSTL